MSTFSRAEPEVDCPVSLERLGNLYRADRGSVNGMLADLSADQRARLAFFCYGKAHLRDLALSIAETVDADRLAQLAGTLGQVLAAQCRAHVKDFSFGRDPLKGSTIKSRISLGGRRAA